MKKYKSLLTLLIGLISTAIIAGCGCAKTVNPVKIEVDKTSVNMFVGNTVDINYTISPVDATKNEVAVSVNKPGVVSLSETSLTGVEGKVTVTALNVDTSGVTITFAIKGTKLSVATEVKVNPDPEKLSPPELRDISFSNTGNKIKFRAVPNASSYEVEIDGTNYAVPDPEPNSPIANRYVELNVFTEDINLTFDQGHIVKVRAIGDGMAYATSEYSEEYKFIKLSPVSEITSSNGTITWKNNEFADRYQIEINGKTESVYPTKNSYKPIFPSAGSYEVRIKATHDVTTKNEEGYHVFEGAYSEKFIISKLGYPTLTLNNDVKVNNVTGFSKITWPEIKGATSFGVTISPALSNTDGTLSIPATDERAIEINEKFLVGTNYKITVTPVGDPTCSFGATTAEITIYVSNVVSGFNVANNILTFNGVESSGGYELVLTKQEEVLAIRSPQSQFDLAEMLSASGTYSLSVRTIGFKNNAVAYANSKLTNANINITKLASPNVLSVSNQGVVSFEQTTVVDNYQIYLDNTYVASTESNSFALDSNTISSGSHIVKVVAIGNGTTTISSGIENANAYQFNKLSTVSEISVLNNEITFDTVSGAVNFSIRINNEAPVLNGVSEGDQKYKITTVGQNGVNYIKIITIGDNIKNISSNEKVFEISRLNAPTSLRVESGKIVWDSAENVYYMVYVGEDEAGTRVNTNEFLGVVTTSQNLSVKVKAISSVSGYLNSDFASVTVNKLAKVDATEIKTQPIAANSLNPNYKLTWATVENATSYDVKISLKDSEVEQTFLGVTNSFVTLEDDLVAGTYNVKIRANGNSDSSVVGYLNSEIENFTFVKFDVPTQIKINNGLLTWTYSGDIKPASYTVGIINQTGEEEVEEIFVNTPDCSLNLEAYTANTLTVRVRANGNEVSTVTGAYGVATQVYHLEKPELNVNENGQLYLVKQNLENIAYNVYVNDVKVSDVEFSDNHNNTTSNDEVIINITSLEDGVSVSVKVESYLQGYLTSLKSEPLTICKLNKVENFSIENGVFGWDDVSNATNYEIINKNGRVFKTTNTSFALSEFGVVDSGVYNFNVRALSNGAGTTKYVNSDFNNSDLKVAITPAPGARIENSKLVLTQNANADLIPTFYKVDVVNADDTVVATKTVDSSTLVVDLAQFTLSAGIFTINVYSVGNNKNVISTNLPTVLNNVEKIDKSLADLKIKEGLICWTNLLLGATFDLYLIDGENTTKVLENYTASHAVLTNLVKGKAYDVKVVIKKNGAIDSDPSSALTVTKLPDVTGLKIVNDGGIIKFSWNSITSGTSYTDTNKFFFEVCPVTLLEPFNGKTMDGSETTINLDFNYPNIYSANFKIRAMGTIANSTNGYLNGDLSGAINVTKLLSVTDVTKNNSNLLTWKNNSSSANGIKLTFTNAENETFEFDLSSETNTFDVTKNLNAGVYSLSIVTMGNINSGVLNSNETLITSVEVLTTISTINVVNGYLNWSQIGDNIGYEIFADETKLTHEVSVLNEDTGESQNETRDYFANFSEALKINEILEANKNITIKIRAKKLVSEEGTMVFDSKFSNEFSVYKLGAASNLRFEDNLLKWSPVKNATGYVIKVTNANATEIFAGDSNFDETIGGIKVVGDAQAVNGYELPHTVTAGVYEFYVAALGNSTSSASEVGMLSGMRSNVVNVTVLGEPVNLRVEKGIIKWDNVVGALKYKVSIKTIVGANEITKTTFVTGNTSSGLESSEYEAALYSATIVAIGNGTTLLNSRPGENSVIKVYKPKAVSNYKVVNGFVYWEMPFDDELMLALNNNVAYDDEQKTQILSSLLDGGLNAPDVFAKYEFLYNVEATINGIVFTNLHPYIVELSADKSRLKFYFDFNFTETGIRNPYFVKVRYLGSGFKDPLVFMVDESGAPGGDQPQQVSYFVNGFYSETISGYKLPAPQTPIVNASLGMDPLATMVKNNKLYFASSSAAPAPTEADEFKINYTITAISQNTNAKIIKTIAYNDSTYYAKDSSGNVISSNIYCVPIADLDLGEDVYMVNVRAIGTPDSALTTGAIYFTSNYNNACSVQLLTTPSVKVDMGRISVSIPANAQKINLRIWDVRAGNVFNPNKNNIDEGIVVTNIEITSDAVANNVFLSSGDGFFGYEMSDNPLFSDGKYYIQVVAEGDGISQVSSKESVVVSVFKTKGIQNVSLREGKFTWDAIDYTYDKTTPTQRIKAKGYDILIIRSSFVGGVYVENSTVMIGGHTVMASEVAGSDARRCYFDLPSNSDQYPAQVISDQGVITTYKYSARVKMHGSNAGSGMGPNPFDYGFYVVSSDSAQSEEYARLTSPVNIRMENGKLIWNVVNSAISYEVYMLDVTKGYPESPADINYGIITNGDYREFNYEASELYIKTGKMYSLIIRALPGGSDTNFLNGEFSPELYVRKLEQPAVRIEDGVVKWNVTELDLAVATKVKIVITGPAGFTPVDTLVDINNMVNGLNGYPLSGTDAQFPAGDYTVTVSFLGSNGKIATSITDPKPDDGGSESGGDETQPETPDPEVPLDEGGDETTTPDVPVFTQDAYCWFSSAPTTITATKFGTLTAERYTLDGNNYIRTRAIANANYYTFTVVKYNGSNVVKTYTTNKYRRGTIDNTAILEYDGYIMYNLADVANYDEQHAGENILFGTEFSVYAQAFGENVLHSATGAKFIISNPSNQIAVEIPVAPSNVTYEYPGTIKWKNYSANTFTRVKVEYDGVTEPKIYNLTQTNVSSFKLKDIGKARVSILSYLKSGDQEILSPYAVLENPIDYFIYSSGNGSSTDPYILTTASQVDNIRYNLNSHFKLGNNITYSQGYGAQKEGGDGFVVSGGSENQFVGTFDGCGYKIENINYTGLNFVNMAFVHTVGTSGAIKNVTIGIIANEINPSNFGGIAIQNRGTISNVTIEGNVYYNALNRQKTIAGVATENHGTITNSVNKANFINSNNFGSFGMRVAGITTHNYGTITYCGNSGKLSGTIVGGITSYNYKTVSKGYNTGILQANVTVNTHQPIVGGIAAYNQEDVGASVNQCYSIISSLTIAASNDSSKAGLAGGIVGVNRNTLGISDCYVVISDATSISATQSSFGIILGAANPTLTNATNYNQNYYLLVNGGSFKTYGVDNSTPAINLAAKVNSKAELQTKLVTELSSIYKEDVLNVNNGYPVFK